MMNNDTAAFSADTIEGLPYKVERRLERIELRDGITLSIKLWLPAGGANRQHGVVLEAIPYRKDDASLIDDEARFPYFAGHGVAGARVDLRGSGSSGGVIQDEYSTIEQADIVEVVHWLAGQPWCNGSVGMMGISWSGFNSLQVAGRHPEPLKAIIAACASDDRYDNDVHYHGGTPLAFYMNLWGSAMRLQNMRPPMPSTTGPEWFEEWVTRLQSNPQVTSLWLSHPERDSYWKQGSICEEYGSVRCPVMFVGGWADAYTDTAFRLLEHLDVPTQVLLGPWGHTWPERPEPGPGIDFLARCVRWWKRWLEGEQNGAESDPAITAYVQEYTPSREDLEFRPGHWVTLESASPAIARQAFRLGAGGVLAEEVWDKGASAVVEDRGIVGGNARHFLPMGVSTDLPPVQNEDDERSLVFETAPLDAPLSMLGISELVLSFTAQAPTGQLFVRITDVDERGDSHLVARGGLNLTHRGGHAPDDVRPLTPGKTESARIPLKASAYRFDPGHRVRVAISTRYWPWLWPSPDDSPITLHLDGCELRIPVLDESEASVGHDPALGKPVVAPVRGVARAGSTEAYWTVDRNERGDMTVVKGYASTPTTTLEDGWSFESTVDRAEFSLRADDPESGRVECRFGQRYAWDGHEATIDLESVMTGSRDAFTVVDTTWATLNGKLIFRERSERVTPRGL